MAFKPAKVIGRILIVILVLVVLIVLTAVILSAVFAPKNVRAMNNAADSAVEVLSENHRVSEKSCGDYEEMTVYGVMKFHVRQYEVEDIGNLSVMTVNVGFMQMASVILNPQDRNLPLVSADYMYMLGNRKCYLEYYDLVEKKDERYDRILKDFMSSQGPYTALKDSSSEPAWFDHLRTAVKYKLGTPDDDEALTMMLTDAVRVVSEAANELPELSDKEKVIKNSITKEYTEGLITQGGISTDAFKKSLGEEVTRDFFSKVLFGTARIDEIK